MSKTIIFSGIHFKSMRPTFLSRTRLLMELTIVQLNNIYKSMNIRQTMKKKVGEEEGKGNAVYKLDLTLPEIYSTGDLLPRST